MAIRKTQEEFEKEVYDLVGNEYKVLSEYVNARAHLLIRHEKCGHEYETTPGNFISRNRRNCRCPECALVARGMKRRKTNEEFQIEVFEKVGIEYTFLDPYTTGEKRLRVKHNLCGYEYSVKPHDFLNNRRCPECAYFSRADSRRKSTEEFKAEVFSLVGNEYSVEGKYTSSKAPMKFRHNKCGFEFSVLVSNFLGLKSGCPKCSSSKGEKTIAAYLDKNDVMYQTQYRIPECRNKRSLPFDFAIFNDNELSMLIEYDGEFHFKAKFGEKAFSIVKQNDGIKNRFCKDNGIKLIRIPYTDFENIEIILNREMA